MSEKNKAKPAKTIKQQTEESTSKTNKLNDDVENVQQQPELEAFLKLVGSRVHQQRKQQKMSRRVLSEKSGVSQRTIVLLESGVGNISIALLFRLASALEQSVQNFMVADTAKQSQAQQVAHQYLNSTLATQKKINNMLNVEITGNTKQKRICLIGLRGAGKSTLGAKLSSKTDTRFVELNDEIEALCGISIQEIMDLYGQEGYRKLEQQALKQITRQSDDIIVAAAGGVVNEEETYSYLLEHFHTVWLKATPEEHISRVIEQGDERPMAGNPEAMTTLRSILISREAHYQRADRIIDTSGQTVKNSTDEIAKTVSALLTS